MLFILTVSKLAELLKDLSLDFANTEMPLRQVIINTHSPVLVGHLNQWNQDPYGSIWFSQVQTLNTNLQEESIQINITKISKVMNASTLQLNIEFSEQEKKFTLSKVKEYLQTTADFETILSENATSRWMGILS